VEPHQPGSSELPARQFSTTSYIVRGLGVLLIILLLWFGVAEYTARKAHEFDEPLVKTLAKIETIKSYSQYVDTSTIVSERPLRVFGWYLVNHANRSYAAFSTTTLRIPQGTQGAGSHDFTHDNIAIGNTVYVKIDTDSDFLKPSINDSHEWHRFSSDEIPEAYKNIAITGPILDNLRIFANNAEHLELIKKYGLESLDGRTLRHYRFKLKSSVPKDTTVGALAERLGDEGTLDIWIDDAQSTIERMLFAHGPYTSTTTLSDFNEEPQIIPPPGFE
jgi:hypothetical protein